MGITITFLQSTLHNCVASPYLNYSDFHYKSYTQTLLLSSCVWTTQTLLSTKQKTLIEIKSMFIDFSSNVEKAACSMRRIYLFFFLPHLLSAKHELSLYGFILFYSWHFLPLSVLITTLKQLGDCSTLMHLWFRFSFEIVLMKARRLVGWSTGIGFSTAVIQRFYHAKILQKTIIQRYSCFSTFLPILFCKYFKF